MRPTGGSYLDSTVASALRRVELVNLLWLSRYPLMSFLAKGALSLCSEFFLLWFLEGFLDLAGVG